MSLLKGGMRPRKPGIKFTKGVLRPHVWIVGEDVYKHSMYMPWQRAKAQANFRDEEWDLPFEDYYNIWNGLWEQRGRGADDLCITRINWEGSWTKDNIEIITRRIHCQRQAQYRKAKGIKYRTRGMDIQKRKTKGN